MPTYEYECESCGHQFERFQSITEEPVKKCPSCGKRKVRRLIGRGGAVIFRGSGFYITDNRSPEYNTQAKAEKGESAGGKPEGPKKSEK